MKPSFERAAAAATLEKFAGDLLSWATQPGSALPEGWRAAYQDRLGEVAALVRRAFAEDRQALAKLREVESEARDFIGILVANPAIAGKPVSEWEVVAFRETFERLAAGRRWFADRVVSLRKDEPRRKLFEAVAAAEAGTDRLPARLAEWRQSLEDFNSQPIDASRIQQLRRASEILTANLHQPDDNFSTASLNAIMEFSRWLRPLVRQFADSLGKGDAEQLALFSPNHETRTNAWEALQARAANRTAGPAIAEAPQASPQGASDTQPGSTPSDSAAGAAAPQGASSAGGDSGDQTEVNAGDQTEVNAKALADHCGCSDRQIRKVLSHFAPSREGNRGQLWWKYGLILKTLRQWSAGTESKRKKYKQWPENAAELQKRKKPHPERSKK